MFILAVKGKSKCSMKLWICQIMEMCVVCYAGGDQVSENSQSKHGSNRGEGGSIKWFWGLSQVNSPSLAELMHWKGSSSPNCKEANVHPSVEEGDSSGSQSELGQILKI